MQADFRKPACPDYQMCRSRAFYFRNKQLGISFLEHEQHFSLFSAVFSALRPSFEAIEFRFSQRTLATVSVDCFESFKRALGRWHEGCSSK